MWLLVIMSVLSFVHAVSPLWAGAVIQVAAPSSSALQLATQARALAAQGKLHEALEHTQQALAYAEAAYGTTHEYVGYILDDMATLTFRLGKPEAALPYAQRAVHIVGSQRGGTSTQYASVANNLATLLFALGRFQDAEHYYRKSYDIFLQAGGLNNEQTASTARNLGIMYVEMSQFAQAKHYYVQALGAYQRVHGPQSIAVANLQLDLAGLDLRQEDLPQARLHAEQARQIVSQQHPGDVEALALSQVMFARIALQQSHLTWAEAELKEVLNRLDATGIPESHVRAAALYNLGFIHILRGQFVEAEPLLKHVLSMYRHLVGEAHPAIARTLHSLAILYKNLGQPHTADELYQRALQIFTASFGTQDASVAATRLEYALLLTTRGEPGRAVLQAEQALAIYQHLPGAWDIQRAYALSSLGFALHRAGELQKAARAFENATQIMARVRGNTSSDLPPGLTELGEIYLKQGRWQEAERVLLQAIRIREKDMALTPQGLAKTLSVLARLRLRQGRTAEALALAQHSVQVMEERFGLTQLSPSTSVLHEHRASRTLFEEYLAIASTAVTVNTEPKLLPAMFKVAQLLHVSGTADAVTRMATRFAAQRSTLGQRVRERQDIVEQWRALDHALTARLGGVDSASKQDFVQELRTHMATLATQLRHLDTVLQHDFPAYTALTNPRPLDLGAAQQLLAPEEALLLHVSADDGTYVFLVRHDVVRLQRTAMTTRELARVVASLRKGLDLQGVKQYTDLPPFDTPGAHYLYQQLIAPVAEALHGVTHVIAVLDGAMQNLPPTVLLASPATSPPQRWEDYQGLDFVGRQYAFSIVPSVSALQALRAVVKPSRSSLPFVGFGDPVLGGEETPMRGKGANILEALVFSIDPTLLRTRMPALPETGEELQAMATILNASPASLFLRTQATETRLKQLDLAQYSVVTFATHGLLAGDFHGLAEPALVLTPPQQPTAVDDGLLTASEIALLTLDANWVILSACNTAGPEGRPGAEGLSGLAKAFFYAGSRALLVSHWAVASDTTVLLTTGALQALMQEPTIGRAEALRRSMLRFMNGEVRPLYAHPAFWAPFVNVGEGKGAIQ